MKREGKLIIGYAQSHGAGKCPSHSNRSRRRVEDISRCDFLVGQGNEKEKLIKLKEEEDLENVFFLDPVGRNAIVQLLKRFDVCYIGWNRCAIYKYGISPNKLLDYMMTGKSAIHSVTASNNPVGDAGCGISVSAEDSREVAKAILEMLGASAEERELMGKKGRDYVLMNHSYKGLARRFLEILYEAGHIDAKDGD